MVYANLVGSIFFNVFANLSSSGALKWDGRDQQGVYVHNGVYFVKLTYPDSQSSKPSPHWLKLIVVK